jgi:hypothetical protein
MRTPLAPLLPLEFLVVRACRNGERIAQLVRYGRQRLVFVRSILLPPLGQDYSVPTGRNEGGTDSPKNPGVEERLLPLSWAVLLSVAGLHPAVVESDCATIALAWRV